MPQLVKGGKYVFAWSHVSGSGRIRIPEEALKEYGFNAGDKIFIINGSRTSKGFAITKPDLIRHSPIYTQMARNQDLIQFKPLPGGTVRIGKRSYAWTEIDAQGSFGLDEAVLHQYDVNFNDNLLVVRGSGFALGLIRTGPIVEEALKHPELMTCR
ncbi:AbrB/MazE/SpoVT family DNA-binding domain-containing protein [bacterium]|nr:AbrB/MazE/SpoVT family DNA-binding domain-containing protein [bacterium]